LIQTVADFGTTTLAPSINARKRTDAGGELRHPRPDQVSRRLAEEA
jgi:hypothetical protein